jgi:hypothetical protein
MRKPDRRTLPLLVFLLTGAASMVAKSSPRIEGTIEGTLVWAGKPVAGAQVTACRDFTYYSSGRSCAHPIETRTDSAGRFSFVQSTGIAPFSKAEVEDFHSKGMAVDPGWSYGFRVDYDGISSLHFNAGLGFGPTRVQLRCDLAEYLARMKLKGIRPIANPGHMPYMECTATYEMPKLE